MQVHKQLQKKKEESNAAAHALSGKPVQRLQDNRPTSLIQKKQAESFKSTFTPLTANSGTSLQATIQLNAKDRKKAKKRAMEERQVAIELKKIKKIAAQVPATNGMDCDRWAVDFQALLNAAGLPFTPKVLIVRPNRDINASGAGAQIHYKGQQIGHDTHFYTVVEILGRRFSFDNINPRGVPENEHSKNLKLKSEDLQDRYNPNLVGLHKHSHLIEENIHAAHLRGRPLTATVKRIRAARRNN